MSTIVFDIETIPNDFDALDEAQQQYLMKYAKDSADQEKVKQQMALWAPTNQIVAIGMLDVDTNKGAVYFQDNGTGLEDHEEGGVVYRSGNEQEILTHFWEVIARAERFVTFNGRQFDCPVLMLRSAMQGVKPTKNLMPYRYKTDEHIDLLDQLTFHGAARKFNIDVYCKAFGIDSPKSHGITGHDVKPLFEEGRYMEIARYCAGDLIATKHLYLKWREYLHFS